MATKKHQPTLDEAIKTYWARIADYEATRNDSPFDYRLQGWAAEQVAVAREEAFKAAERLNRRGGMEKREARQKAILTVCSETGEDEKFFQAKKRGLTW